MKYLASIILFLLIVLQLELWFGSYGVFQLNLLRQNIERSKEKNASLLARNAQLQSEMLELKQGKEALEERARSQLGFIKPGEVFYRLLPAKEAAAQGKIKDPE